MSHFPIFKHSHFHPHPFAIDMWGPFPDMSPPRTPLGADFGWEETAEGYAARVELPGLRREEVKVEVREGKSLKISGRKNVEREERHENWHHVERSHGNFVRVLTLPENCRADRVRSCLEDGVLVVTVPKREVGNRHPYHGRNIEMRD